MNDHDYEPIKKAFDKEVARAKRFEEWEEVDCNECTHYWDSSCDAVKQDDRRQCNSFLATRRVVIPAKIKALEKSVKTLYILSILYGVALVLSSVVKLLGG